MSAATQLNGSDVDAHLPLAYGCWLEQKRIERERVLRAEHDRQLSAAIGAIYRRYLAERAYAQWRRQHDNSSRTTQREDEDYDAPRRRALCIAAFTQWRKHKSRSARAAAVSQCEQSQQRRRQEESQRALSAERSHRAYAARVASYERTSFGAKARGV